MQNQVATDSPPPPSRSPIPIVTRRMRIEFDRMQDRFFFGDNGFMSSFMAALSSVFPPGEKEFIDSVHEYADQISDEKLRKEVKSFSAQEGHHSHQHRLANEVLDGLGYQATAVAEMMEKEIEKWRQERSTADRLAVTVVMEHITACMAHFALSQPSRFAKLPEPMQELVFWHAVEEIEHKSVAFDVYEQCVGERNRLRLRLLQQMVLFPLEIYGIQRFMMKGMKHRPSLREYREAASFLFGRRGMVSGVMPQYLALLKPGFHPWDIDDSDLVQAWKDRLESTPADERNAA